MKTVLVAEDRDTSRELIRTILEHCGYAVIEALDGEQAVALTREKRPDLLLLDLQMPLKTGFEVVTELRADERFRRTPIVAVTASAMQGDRERALKDGFTAYLTKPLTFADLRRELSRLLPESSSAAAATSCL